MSETTHIQSNESRRTVLSFFCLFISIASLLIIPFYWYLQLVLPIIVSASISLIFTITYFLNKKGHFDIARGFVLFASNTGVIYFSLFLGYNSGIYLYILVAPLLIYLLYDFQDRLGISFAFSSYIVSFAIIYFVRDQRILGNADVSSKMLEVIFAINLFVTFIMLFILVIFFANNNHRYILQLMKHQDEVNDENIRRKSSEMELQKALKERELLLSEVHHRVKNNLAIISALLNLESAELGDERSQEIFKETRDRIYAISMVHNLLYKNPSLQQIDMVEFFDQFCSNIIDSYSDGRIRIEQHIQPVNITIETAVPMALLLNELVTNAIKHAFPGERSGLIQVGLEPRPNGGFLFYVSDNGIGMKEEQLDTASTGMNIIHSLAEQLEARIEFRNGQGTRLTVVKEIIA